MALFCPNPSSKEWKEHSNIVGESFDYITWSNNGGHPMDMAPDGTPSELFETLLNNETFYSKVEIADSSWKRQSLKSLKNDYVPISKFIKLADKDVGLANSKISRRNNRLAELNAGYHYRSIYLGFIPTQGHSIAVYKVQGNIDLNAKKARQSVTTRKTADTSDAINKVYKAKAITRTVFGENILNEMGAKKDSHGEWDYEDVINANIPNIIDAAYADIQNTINGIGFKNQTADEQALVSDAALKLQDLYSIINRVTSHKRTIDPNAKWEDTEEIDLSKELEVIRKVMPNVPIQVSKGLLKIPGGFAEGRFYNSMIEVFTGGNAGVVYHEAFHAISQMYLNKEEQSALYKEVRDNYGPMSNKEAEEILAEDFREYMLGREKPMGALQRWFTDMLESLLNLFRNDKNELFTNIRKGRFAYKPTYESADTHYSLAIPSAMTRDAVEGIVYDFVNESGLRNLSKTFTEDNNDFNFIINKVKVNIEKKIETAIQKYQEAPAEDEGKAMIQIASKLKFVLNNWAEFEQLVKSKLNQINIEVDDDVAEEEAKENLNITNAVNISSKKNASGNTKLLVAMLPSEYRSAYFGDFFPRLAKFSETWNILENSLTNITYGKVVNNEVQDEKSQMLDIIFELGNEHHQFVELYDILTDPKFPEYKKTQFFRTFHRMKVDYVATIYDPKTGVAKMGDADSQSRAKQIKSQWVERVKLNDISKTKLKNAVTKFTEANSLKELHKVLNTVGIDVSFNALTDYKNSLNKSKDEDNVKAVKLNLTHMFKNPNNSVTTASVNGLEEGKNYLTNQKVVNTLAEFEVKYKKIPGDNMVYGADGKSYYTMSSNNFIVKQLNLWKNDIRTLRNLRSKMYHSGSKFLAQLESKIINGEQDNIGVKVFLFNRIEGDADSFSDYSELKDKDDYIERINLVLNPNGAQLPMLTPADKSTWFLLDGFETEKFKLKEGGITEADEKVIDYFYDYAVNEIVRISKNLQNPATNLGYYNKASQNSFWFDGLGANDDFAKEINLYTNNVANIVGNESKIKEYVRQVLNERLGEEIATLKSMDVMKHVSKDVIKAYSNDYYEILSDFVLNSMVANIESTMLFAGDPAFYKDLPKRMPASQATGDDMMIYATDKTYKIATINDEDVTSTLIEGYRDNIAKDLRRRKKLSKEASIEEANNVVKPYSAMTQADGQAFITPYRFKSIMKGLGMWNSELHDDLFDEYMKFGTLDSYSKLMKEFDFPSGQPVKGHHFEFVDNGDNIVPVYLKYSQAVLWPSVVKGTRMEKVLSRMISSGVDELVMKSGSKGGVINSMSIGSFMTDENLNDKLVTLNNYNYRRQVDLSPKYDKTEKATRGSQPVKNMQANIGDLVFEVDGNIIDGHDMAKEINDVESKISNLENKSFKDNYFTNDRFDKSKFTKELVKQLIKEEVSNNVVEALRDNSELPFEAVFQSFSKIENTIHSMINRSVKIKAKGGAFIQISNQYMEKLSGISNMTELDLMSDNKIIYLKNVDTIRGPRMENGVVVPGEVFIPYKLLEKIPNIDTMIKNGITGAKIKELLGDTLNIIGYRIPNQAINSIDSLEIAGILPRHMGDSIITYTEVVGKTGSDFDIDKMFVLMPHSYWDEKEGIMKLIPDNLNTRESLENRRINLWRKILEHPDMFAQVVSPIDSPALKNNAYYIDFLTDSKSLVKNVKSMGYKSVEDFLASPTKEEDAYKFMSNKKYKALEFATTSTQMKIKRQNMAGKAGVGQTANHLTHHALSQHAKLAFNGKILNKGIFDENGNNVLYSDVNEKNDYITHVISNYMNAYVDNAKDPYISLINNNTKTAGLVFTLLRMGVDPKWVNMFVSQPIVKAYVQAEFDSESKFTDVKSKDFYTLKVNAENQIESIAVKNREPDSAYTALSKFKIDANSITTDINEDLVADNSVLEKQLINPDSAIQLEIFKKFLQLNKIASSVNNVTIASKFDTVGSGANYAETIVMKNRLEKALQDPNLVNVDKLFDGTALNTYYDNTIQFLEDNIRIGMTNSISMEVTIQEFAKQQGIEYFTNEDTINLLMRQFKAYMYSGASEIKGSFKDMYFGNNTMADKLAIVKKLLPDNVLFDAFGYSIKKGAPKFVTLPSSKHRDLYDIDSLWIEFERLLKSKDGDIVIGKKGDIEGTSLNLKTDRVLDLMKTGTVTTTGLDVKPGYYVVQGGIKVYVDKVGDKYIVKAEKDSREYYKVSDFMKDLVKLAFRNSGFNKNLNSFYDVIPHTYLRGDFTKAEGDKNITFTQYVADKISELQEPVVQLNFLDQFYRHNWENNSIVPSASSFGMKPKRDSDGTLTFEQDQLPAVWVSNTLYDPDSQSKFKVTKPYVKIKSVDNFGDISYRLYKFKEMNLGKTSTYVYAPVGKLGYSSGGNYIFEYDFDNKVTSIVNPSYKTEDQFTKLDDVKINHEGNELGKFTKVDKNTFKYSKFPNNLFYIAKETHEGKILYKPVLMKMENGELVKPIDVLPEGEFGEDVESAVEMLKQHLATMDSKTIVSSLINQC